MHQKRLVAGLSHNVLQEMSPNASDTSKPLMTVCVCSDTVGWVTWPVKTCPRYDQYLKLGL